MSKYLLFILSLLLSFQQVISQESSMITVSFRDIPGLSDSRIYLYLLSNRLGKQSLVDSVVVKNESKALLHIPADKNPGLYTTLLYAHVNGQSVQSTFNFLFDKKNIGFNTCIKTPVDSMKVSASGVNSSYFSFINQKNYYSSCYSKLLELKQLTRPDDTFYQDLNNQINKILVGQKELFTKIRDDDSDNIASKYNRWLLSSEIYANELKNI